MDMIYTDMYSDLVDFPYVIEKIHPDQKLEFAGEFDEVHSIFSLMDPLEDAIKSFNKYILKSDEYVLWTALEQSKCIDRKTIVCTEISWTICI